MTNDVEFALRCFVDQTKLGLRARLCELVSRAEAEDVLQDAYLKVYLLASKNPQPISGIDKLTMLKPYLYTVAKNQALSLLRHSKVVEKHCKSSLGEQAIFNLEDSLSQAENKALLMEAINDLPPICRQVFVQRKIHGKCHNSIATMLGISTKTVENHITKGLRLCREYIQIRQRCYSESLQRNVG